jgi:hypothetical protein
MDSILANLKHPAHGWKTTHFWGPVANWGLVIAGVYDLTQKGPEVCARVRVRVITVWHLTCVCLHSAGTSIPHDGKYRWRK